MFRGRYKAINIEASNYLLEVSRYIHRNPVKTKKPLVNELERYRWSSYPAYRNQAEVPEWLYKDAVLSELGSGQPTAAYRRYVESGIDEETEKIYAKNQWPAVRGDEKFAEKAHLNSKAKKPGVSRERREVASGEILKVVAGLFGCGQKELLKAKRSKGVDNTGRAMAMKLCQEQGSMKLSEIANVFRLGSDSGVTKTIGRLEQRMKADQELLKSYNILCRDLTP